MAYIAGTSVDAASSAITLSIPSYVQENDLLFLMSTRRYGSWPAIPSGWSSISIGTCSLDGTNSSFFYLQVPSTVPTTVTVDCGSAQQCVTLIVVRGADVVTPLDGVTPSSVCSSSDIAQAPSVTVGSDNALILNLWFGSAVNSAAYHAVHPDVYEFVRNDLGSLMQGAVLSYVESSGGASHQSTWEMVRDATGRAHLVTLSIRDDGNNIRDAFVDESTPMGEIIHYGFTGASKARVTTAVEDPTAFIPSVTDGAFTATSVYNSLTPYTGFYTNLGSGGCRKSSAGSTGLEIKSTVLNSTLDLAGEIVIFSILRTTGLKSSSSLGAIVGFSDGTNSKLWEIETSDAAHNSSLANLPCLIEVDGGYEIDEIGTFNSSTLNRTVTGSYLMGANREYGTGLLYKVRTMVLLGGATSRPVSFYSARKITPTGGIAAIGNQNSQTEKQLFACQHLQLGDGTRALHFDSTYDSVQFPDAYDADNGKTQFQISAAKLELTCRFSALDTIILDATTLNFGNYHKFTIHALTNTPSTLSTNGLVIAKATVTLNDVGVPLSGISFSGCKEIVKNSADLSGGCVINGCVDTYAITVTSQAAFEALQNCTFSGNDHSIRITGDQSGSWSGAGIKISGKTGTYDIEYTGTTNFSIQADTGQVWAVNNTSTGTLTIVAPIKQLEVTSNIAGSDIKIFATGTQTIEASGTGTSVTTTTAGTYDITVMKAGYLPQRQTGIVLGADSVTVAINLVADPVYNASHGLAYTTDLTYNRSTKKLTCVTRQAGRDFYSALIDNFISQSSLDNTPFDFQAIGIDSIFFLDDAELFDSTSEDNWYDAGIRYLSASDVVTAEWCSIKSSGSIPAGVTGRYQYADGSGTTALRTTGAVNQIIQIYGDATHGNFDRRSYMVIKFQANPYVDTRSDILALANVTTLEPFEYSVAISPEALDVTPGDSGASLTLVDHTSAPKVVGGKSFDYEIIDNGANTAEDILRAWDYNIAQTGTYQTYDTFNLPEFIKQSGSTYETRQGIVEGSGGTLSGCYVSRGGADHPDFVRHQSNDGTYYVKPVLANISITGLTDGAAGHTRLQIYNVTTATEIYNDDPAGTSYSDSYTNGVGISAGDTIRIRFADLNDGTSFSTYDTTVIAATSGFSVAASPESDSVYASNGVDGSSASVTAKFTPDYVNNEVDLQAASNFTAAEAYAFFCYTLTLTDGIAQFWGGVTANDAGNYRINAATLNLYFDNLTTTNVRQTDSARIYRDDETYPVKGGGVTTGGGGIDINWQNVVYVVSTGGSALTPAEQAQLSSIESKTNSMTFTKAGELDANVQSLNGTALQGTGAEGDLWRG